MNKLFGLDGKNIKGDPSEINKMLEERKKKE